MKQMLDIIRKATEMKEFDFETSSSIASHYAHGQMQVLDYIIDNSLIPEEIKPTIEMMYENGVRKYKEAGQASEINDELAAELIGAADILAWILDIPEEVHQKVKSLDDI